MIRNENENENRKMRFGKPEFVELGTLIVGNCVVAGET